VIRLTVTALGDCGCCAKWDLYSSKLHLFFPDLKFWC